MINAELFMADYNAIKQEFATETEKAENAILNLMSLGYNLSDEESKNMVDVLVSKAVGQAKYDTLKFYEKYIVPDVVEESNVYGEV